MNCTQELNSLYLSLGNESVKQFLTPGSFHFYKGLGFRVD